MNARIAPAALPLLCSLLLATAGPALGAQPGPDSPEFPAYVMGRLDDMHRGRSSHGVLEMRVKTRHWARTLGLESWSLGKDYSLVRILQPKKERGTATLKSKAELFTYLNETGRTIKITGGMMGGSWMGSHFTNDDLVRETRLSESYVIARLADGQEGAGKTYRFALTPRPNAPVVWGKVEVAVRQADLAPVSQLFYDEDGKPVRQLEFSDHRVIDGQPRPMRLLMKPLDKPDEFTELLMKELQLNIAIEPDFFSLLKLKAG